MPNRIGDEERHSVQPGSGRRSCLACGSTRACSDVNPAARPRCGPRSSLGVTLTAAATQDGGEVSALPIEALEAPSD